MFTINNVLYSVPENSLDHHHHQQHKQSARRGRQNVPLFVENEKNVFDFVESEKGVPRFKANVNKVNPFIKVISMSQKQSKGPLPKVISNKRSKFRDRGAKNGKKGERVQKKQGRSRGLKKPEVDTRPKLSKRTDLKNPVQRQFTRGGRREASASKSRENQNKGKVVTFLGGGRSDNFVTKKGRRRKKQAPGPLSAGDLWSLNR